MLKRYVMSAVLLTSATWSVAAEPSLPTVAVPAFVLEQRVADSVGDGADNILRQNEVQRLSADVRGALHRSGFFKVVAVRQAKQEGSKSLSDAVARIKAGDFGKVDYVLFGVVNVLDLREDIYRVPSSAMSSQTYSLDVVVDFNLIDTDNYAVESAFSAQGAGRDVVLNGRRGRSDFNKAKLLSEASETLAADVVAQFKKQFNADTGARRKRAQDAEVADKAAEGERKAAQEAQHKLDEEKAQKELEIRRLQAEAELLKAQSASEIKVAPIASEPVGSR